MPKIIVDFTNGSTSEYPVACVSEGYRFANRRISYTRGKVARVQLQCELGCVRTLFCGDWTSESNIAALKLPL
jgi:hypothetical protein